MEKIKEGPHTSCRHQTRWNLLLGRILNGWRKKTVLSHDDDDDDDDDVLINNF